MSWAPSGGNRNDNGGSCSFKNNSLKDSLILEYTTPKLKHHNYDVKKDWYVWFTARDPETGKKKLFIYKKGINYHKGKAQRLKEANALRLALENALSDGFDPFRKNYTNFRPKYLHESIENILEVKRSSLKPKSIRTYGDVVAMFTAWLAGCRMNTLPASKFTRADAIAFGDYLLKERKYSGKSFNNTIGIMKTFFNDMIRRDECEANPFRGIAELPESAASNVPYTEAERDKVADYLKRYNPRLYYAINFVFYCFIRRSELILLRVRDVSLENHSITISSEISKNRKTESITMPREFERIIRELKLNEHSPDEFVFGHKFNTCSRRIMRADSFSTAMKRVNNELGISGKSFYSWKHTGVCELYKATKDPYLVMRQCRHSDLKITLIYLRSMGLTVDEKVRDADFRI